MLGKGPWLQMYTVPGKCTPLGQQATWGSPSRTLQAGDGSFLLLARRPAFSSQWLWTFNHNMCKNNLEEVQRVITGSFFPTTSLSRHMAMCIDVECREQCSMPVRLGLWQSQTSNVCSKLTGQWSDRSAMSSRKTLSSPDPVSYLCGFALSNWTLFWRRKGSAAMDMWNAPMVQSRQPLTCRWMKSIGLGGPRWHGCRWQRGIAESGSSHDRHTWRFCNRSAMRAASQLPGRGYGCCPCTCTLIKNLMIWWWYIVPAVSV